MLNSCVGWVQLSRVLLGRAAGRPDRSSLHEEAWCGRGQPVLPDRVHRHGELGRLGVLLRAQYITISFLPSPLPANVHVTVAFCLFFGTIFMSISITRFVSVRLLHLSTLERGVGSIQHILSLVLKRANYAMSDPELRSSFICSG
jgi:hypothetical protein